VHVAIDDHSRIAFLRQSLTYYARLGIRVRALLTDNGAAYRSRAFTQACRELGLKHRCTRPYTPRTNGKAERFIQTSLREWAYARQYQNSNQRSQELRPWLHQYNWHRPHASLNHAPPISRAGIDQNNLLSLHN
jgi:transposase InsO family protein